MANIRFSVGFGLVAFYITLVAHSTVWAQYRNPYSGVEFNDQMAYMYSILGSMNKRLGDATMRRSLPDWISARRHFAYESRDPTANRLGQTRPGLKAVQAVRGGSER